ncbi:phage late control D family protein [Vibrio spartinae]|uniref:Phage late control gene D protein (GPD) n=1 Tax=Vibrio spartinae TaxID=1918945 RepID=A0A1N6M6E7_9VIBR|nr:phage late control D family protein [Vibrio spartinae]QMV14721.1 tail protein [Vibrio spartinae]SIO94999.1 Phage late control gene D protein (GPD) [Vibrio spartinae]
MNSRLISWERIDVSAAQSDQITLHVDTAGQTGLPKEGAELIFSEGYQGQLVHKGKYKITRISPKLFPPTVTIVATAAPFQIQDKTGFKERHTRTFTFISLAEIFRQLVTSHGFSPRVASKFETVWFKHIDQMNETDSAFLVRLAKRHDAIAKPVDGLYVLAEKGQTKTITGQDIPSVTVDVSGNNDPSDFRKFINCQLELASRRNFFGVKAKWVESDTGLEYEVSSGEAPFVMLQQVYEDSSVAQQTCDEELQKIMREKDCIRIDLPGDPYLVAEGILELNQSFPPEMVGRWSIDQVTARGDSSGGYRCSVVATRPARKN